MSEPSPELLRVGERALLVRFGDADLARAVVRAHALAARLRRVPPESASPERYGAGRRNREDERFPVYGEWVLGAGNLLVRLDGSGAAGEVEALAARLTDELRVGSLQEGFSTGATHSIEVEFGLEDGPDLRQVARESGISEDGVVDRLCAASFTVAFVGFSPGFPYLIGLPPELEVPRLDEPRARVPAGSVAIAGPFAGIYPSATPGGWRLLGRTDEPLFDPAGDPPARLRAGDRVRFVAR